MKIQLLRKDCPIYDRFLKDVAFYQVDANMIDIDLEVLRSLIKSNEKGFFVGEVNGSFLVLYSGIFYVISLKKENFSLYVELSPEYNKEWVFNHSFVRNDEFSDETIMLQALKYYTQTYRKNFNTAWY